MSEFARVLLRLDAPSDPAAFERAWLELATAADAAPGHLGDTLSRDVQTPGRYWITTDWVDLESFQRFSSSPAHEVFAAHISKLVLDRAGYRTVGLHRVGAAEALR